MRVGAKTPTLTKRGHGMFKESVNQAQIVREQLIPIIKEAKENGVSLQSLYVIAGSKCVTDKSTVRKVLNKSNEVQRVTGKRTTKYFGNDVDLENADIPKSKTELIEEIVIPTLDTEGKNATDIFEIVTATVDVSLVELKDNYLNELSNNGVIVKKIGKKEGDTRQRPYYFAK